MSARWWRFLFILLLFCSFCTKLACNSCVLDDDYNSDDIIDLVFMNHPARAVDRSSLLLISNIAVKSFGDAEINFCNERRWSLDFFVSDYSFNMHRLVSSAGVKKSAVFKTRRLQLSLLTILSHYSKYEQWQRMHGINKKNSCRKISNTCTMYLFFCKSFLYFLCCSYLL